MMIVTATRDPVRELRSVLARSRRLGFEEYRRALDLITALDDEFRNPDRMCSACLERGISCPSVGDFGLCAVHLRETAKTLLEEERRQYCPFCMLNYDIVPATAFGMCVRHFTKSQQALQ